VERISSRQNTLVKRFRELARAGRSDEWLLLDGEHVIGEALKAGVALDAAAFAERLVEGRLATMAAQARRGGATVVSVTDQVAAALSPVQHPSGVVAIARRPETALDAVFSREPQLVLVLNDVQDPGNVGAIVRAAEACGATGVVTTEGTADPFGWKALRGAMGSTFRMPVASHQAASSVIAHARASGMRVVATVPRGGVPLPQCDLRGPVAVLLGGEGGGLTTTAITSADERLTIVMQPPVESLNVAIAAALIVYEASRQRSMEAHVPVR
jgi:TrmH family RNA methyltransferase